MRHLLQACVFATALAVAACGTPGASPTPPSSSGDGGSAVPTWHRDVLPLVQTHCQGCHVEGAIGPFALQTYAQGAAMHAAIANAVQSRRMPPWMPSPDCNSYTDERRLTDAEIQIFVSWSAHGGPEGDPADAPASPPPPQGLPWVDATLDPGVDYIPSVQSGSDDYHCFIVDPALSQNQDVIGFDIVPGARRMVHHVLLYSAKRTDALNKDAQTPDTPGWTCFGGPETPQPSVVGGWVPGTPVTRYPEGTGIRLRSDQVLVMQVHYNLTGGAEPDRTTVKLQYSKAPVAKVAQIFPQAIASFAIPPHSSGYSVEQTEEAVPVPVTIYGVLPHMHALGKSIRVEVAGGQCLVDIPKWDFHWQQFYMLKTPVQLQPGDSRQMRCGWDNPTDRTVTWGEGTADEMCLNYVYVTF